MRLLVQRRDPNIVEAIDMNYAQGINLRRYRVQSYVQISTCFNQWWLKLTAYRSVQWCCSEGIF